MSSKSDAKNESVEQGANPVAIRIYTSPALFLGSPHCFSALRPHSYAITPPSMVITLPVM